MNNNNKFDQYDIKIILGSILCLCGILFLFLGFYVDPLGIIDYSVISGVSLLFSFSGVLLGIKASIDYFKDTKKDNNL